VFGSAVFGHHVFQVHAHCARLDGYGLRLPAVATSSPAAPMLTAFADGQHLPWRQIADAVARICRSVKVPVKAISNPACAAERKALETSSPRSSSGRSGREPGRRDARKTPTPNTPMLNRLIQAFAWQSAVSAGGAGCAHPGCATRRHGRRNPSGDQARTDAYCRPASHQQRPLRNTLERGQAYLQAAAIAFHSGPAPP